MAAPDSQEPQQGAAPLRSGDVHHHVAVAPDGGQDSNPTDQPTGRNRTDQGLAEAS